MIERIRVQGPEIRSGSNFEQVSKAQFGEKGALAEAIERKNRGVPLEVVIGKPGSDYVQGGANIGFLGNSSHYAHTGEDLEDLTIVGEDQAVRLGPCSLATQGGITLRDIAFRNLTFDTTNTLPFSAGQSALSSNVNSKPIDGLTLENIRYRAVSPSTKWVHRLHAPTRDLRMIDCKMEENIPGAGAGEHFLYADELLGTAHFEDNFAYRCRRTSHQIVSRIATNIGITGDALISMRQIIAKQCGEHQPFALTVAGGRHSISVKDLHLEDTWGAGINIYCDRKTLAPAPTTIGSTFIPALGRSLAPDERVTFDEAVALGLVSPEGHCFNRVEIEGFSSHSPKADGRPFWIRSTRLAIVHPLEISGAKWGLSIGGPGKEQWVKRLFLAGQTNPAEWKWNHAARWVEKYSNSLNGYWWLSRSEVEDLWRKKARA